MRRHVLIIAAGVAGLAACAHLNAGGGGMHGLNARMHAHGAPTPKDAGAPGFSL